jgi:PAS domain S-box-containing protein
MTASLIRDGDGEPQWYVAALTELSEQRILEQQLAATKRLAGLMTWSWDAKSDQATTSGSEIFGFSKGHVSSLTKTLAKIHPDDRRAVEATIRRSVVTGTGYVHEYRVINTKGEIRHMQGTATCVLDEAGIVTHLVGATIDVTNTKSRQSVERAPEAIREVLKYIEMNWNKPIYLVDVANQLCISPRAIQRYFASRGMTLTSYVKTYRLRHAHQALGDPKPETSVTGIALYCGFQNAGHFAREYREKFGELPSETLRKAIRALDTD